MKSFLSFWITAMIALTAHATPTFTDPAKPILIQPNIQTVSLTLKANRTTGYDWLLVKNSKWLQVTGRTYMPSKSNLVGAPGYEVWTFSVDKNACLVPRTFSVVLRYQRPWEKAESTATDTTFTFVTQSNE